MTSRESVLAALDQREPDLVPIDFSGHRSSGVAAIVYRKLRECLGLPPTTICVYDPIQRLAIVDEDVLDRFGVDAIEMGRGFALDGASWADWTLPDGTPSKMPAWALPERRDGEWACIRRRAGSSAECPAALSFSSSPTDRSLSDS
jgi:uroporphyrinogen decarboxylase